METMANCNCFQLVRVLPIMRLELFLVKNLCLSNLTDVHTGLAARQSLALHIPLSLIPETGERALILYCHFENPLRLRNSQLVTLSRLCRI